MTKTGLKFFIRKCFQNKGKKSVVVSDNTIAVEGVGKFLEKK